MLPGAEAVRKDEITQWRRAFDLFRLVSSAELPADADSGYASVGGQDESDAVKEKLRQLLSSHQLDDDSGVAEPLDSLIVRLSFSGQSDADDDELDSIMKDKIVGGWRILRRLGRGGMASIYLAERQGVEFRQYGALKLLSLLMLATGGQKRFAREQQFLAQLQHPNIAMLLDGGVADDGTPYLVTEVVEGLNIVEFCQQNSLTVRQRVVLLIQVCEAVRHAHGKLILHRDIKPGNILVNKDGQSKLLDFGIGKLVRDTPESTISQVFTPKYAAPEQLQGAAVSTATDVFGLGTLGLTLLDERLEGHHELASVLMQASHEDVDRRYPSAESLLLDLRNWIENRPITAITDSAAYRFRKFISRNKSLVLMCGSMVLLAMFATASVFWQANAARLEAEKSSILSEFMIDLFADGDLFSGQGPETPISSIMQAGAERARLSLQRTPAAHSEMLRVIGLAQTEFGEYEDAGVNLNLALESADSPLQQARVLGSLGVWQAEQAEYSMGIASMQQALALMGNRLPVSHPDRLEIETDLINFLLFAGEDQKSMDRADRLIATLGSMQDLPASEHANVLRSRAMALTQRGRFEEAIEHLQEALRLVANLQPARPALTAAYLNDLGIAYYYIGAQAKAIDALASSYQAQIEIYGPEHKRVITSGSNLVLTMRAAGQIQRAIELGESVLAVSVQAHGDIHRSTSLARFALALALTDADRHDEAEAQLTASIAALRELEDMRAELPSHLAWQGEVLIRQAKFAEAIAVLLEAESIRDHEFPEVARRYRVASQNRLVQAQAALGNCTVAREYQQNIQDDMDAAEAGLALASDIYLLNCQTTGGEARIHYSEILTALDDVEIDDPSMRAALRWAWEQGF